MLRIERYASPVPVQANSSDVASQSPFYPTQVDSIKQSSPVLPARLTQTFGSQSTVSPIKVDFENSEHQGLSDRPSRSSSLVLSPSAMSSSPYWHGQPKIFPGLVHEQTRRESMRGGSESENYPASLAGGGDGGGTTDWSGEIEARDQGPRRQQRRSTDANEEERANNSDTA